MNCKYHKHKDKGAEYVFGFLLCLNRKIRIEISVNLKVEPDSCGSKEKRTDSSGLKMVNAFICFTSCRQNFSWYLD